MQPLKNFPAYWGCRQSQQYFWLFLSSYFLFCYVPTTCFGPYGPSSGAIYTSQSSEAIVPTTDLLFLLRYTIVIYILFLFSAIPPLSVCMRWIQFSLCYFMVWFARGLRPRSLVYFIFTILTFYETRSSIATFTRAIIIIIIIIIICRTHLIMNVHENVITESLQIQGRN
jgi:hypothetical protein